MADAGSTEPPVESGERRGNAFVQFYRYVFGVGHERNVGGMERTIRYTAGALSTLVGLGIVVYPVLGDATTNTVLALVLVVTGLSLLYEAQVQYCPLNHTIGRSTYSGE